MLYCINRIIIIKFSTKSRKRRRGNKILCSQHFLKSELLFSSTHAAITSPPPPSFLSLCNFISLGTGGREENFLYENLMTAKFEEMEEKSNKVYKVEKLHIVQ